MHHICRNAPHLSTCAIFAANRPTIKNPNLRICSAPQKRCPRPIIRSLCFYPHTIEKYRDIHFFHLRHIKCYVRRFQSGSVDKSTAHFFCLPPHQIPSQALPLPNCREIYHALFLPVDCLSPTENFPRGTTLDANNSWPSVG